ncbi:helix-turn-helix domain-containing protein [Streptomyces sp. NPDC088353]|uniref:helix-turn-helix domain-containing protein n=1 Tax=Streptomyces sp. NPDC088353 TaxID=3365855 RepID=UPI0037FCE211
MSYGRNPALTGTEREVVAADFADLYRKGNSIRHIARQTGRSYGNVRQLLLDAGVELRSRGGDQRSVGRRGAL